MNAAQPGATDHGPGEEPTRYVSRAAPGPGPEPGTGAVDGGRTDEDAADADGYAAESYAPDFRPTHVVPRDGLSAWEAPDPARPAEPLDPFLPVRLLDRVGDWGRVLCANGWAAWVDARLLVSVPADPPAAGSPLARTADPRPLIERAQETLARYRRAAEDLAAGRTDGETFRRRTRGLRVGMVVDGESVWLYDAEHERWVYCDGTALSTYMTSSPPSADPAPSPAPAPEPEPEPKAVPEREAAPEAEPEPVHEPTRVVPRSPGDTQAVRGPRPGGGGPGEGG